MTGRGLHAPESLTGAEWELLFNQTVLYATGHVDRWLWRGSIGGVLPEGHDPNSIAAQAVADLLEHPRRPGSRSNPGLLEFRRELERLVRKQVNRLHHRSENRLLRNEPDLALVTLDDGEAVSITELVPEPSRQPDEALIEKESLIRFGRFKLFFSVFLGRDRRVLRLFNLFCDGLWRPEDLASSLKLRPSAIKNLRRRFLRKWAQFHRGSF